jgi:hypothetical protein
MSAATARIDTSCPSRSSRRAISTISSYVAWRWRSRRVSGAPASVVPVVIPEA